MDTDCGDSIFDPIIPDSSRWVPVGHIFGEDHKTTDQRTEDRKPGRTAAGALEICFLGRGFKVFQVSHEVEAAVE
jgi:hypothetical protein